jgi:hypothetical protein
MKQNFKNPKGELRVMMSNETECETTSGSGGNKEENFGDQGLWQLISQTVTKGRVINTTAMEIPGSGCVIKTNTTSGFLVVESLCFVPFVKVQTLYGPVPEGITEFKEGEYPIFGRQIIQDPKSFFTSSTLSNMDGNSETEEELQP